MKFNVFSFIMLKYENKYFDGHVDVYKNVRRRPCIQSYEEKNWQIRFILWMSKHLVWHSTVSRGSL